MGLAKSHKLLERLSSEAAEWNYVRGMDVRVRSRFEKLLKWQLRHVCLSIRLPAWNDSAPTSTDFNEIVYLNIFRISDENRKV